MCFNCSDDVNGSLSISLPESSSDESSGSKQVHSINECVRNSGSNSPASGALSEHQLADRNESSSPQNFDNYANIRLVHNSPSYTPSQSQQQQDPPEVPSFSVSLHLCIKVFLVFGCGYCLLSDYYFTPR